MKNFYRYLFVCLLVGLCACSDDKEEPKQPEQESPLSQSEIKLLKSYQTDGITRLFSTDEMEMKAYEEMANGERIEMPWQELFGFSTNYLGNFILRNDVSYIELSLYYSSMIFSDVTSVWYNYKKYKENMGETVPTIYYSHNDCINISKGEILVGEYSNVIESVTEDAMTLYSTEVFKNYLFERKFTVQELDDDALSNIVTVDSQNKGILYIIDTAIETFGDTMSSSQIPGSTYEWEVDLKALKEKYEKKFS